jgi:hypothetical protein
MRQLTDDETARPGDWMYLFGGYGGWTRIDNKPAPVLRMSIREMNAEHDRRGTSHFPIIIARPNFLEALLGTPPNWKPNQHKIRKATGTHARSKNR